MKKLFAIVFITLICFTLSFTALAAEDIVWDFNIKGELDGWVATNSKVSVDGGYLTGIATTNQIGQYDPYISHKTDFKAEEYSYIVFSMMHENERVTSNAISIYFKPEGAGLSENTRVGNPPVLGKSTDGKHLIYVFDMSTNSFWKDTIQSIRIDMLSAAGSFSFDYIKVTDTIPEAFDNITESSSSAGGGVSAEDGFKKQNTYTNGQFTDVAESDWFNPSVSGAYELGFMNGKSALTFDPNGNVTVAEAITIASRIHNTYFNKNATFQSVQDSPWYTPYIAYATENNFFQNVTFDNYDRNIKRYEMAVLFGSILPEKWLPSINNVGYIPDLPIDAPYKSAIISLYNAGIVMGSDAYGSFYPENDITRAEAAAIINRLAIKDKRITGSLLIANELIKTDEIKEEGHYLIDNPTMIYGGEGLQQTWQYSYEGMKPNYTGAVTNSLDDTSDSYGTFIRRAITPQASGVLDLSARLKINYNYDGVYLSLCDNSGKQLVYIYTDDSVYCVKSAGKEIKTGVKVQLGADVWVDAYINLDTKKYDLYIASAYCGTFDFAENAVSADYVEIGTTEKGIPMVVIQSVFLRKGYYLADDFNKGEKSAFTTIENGVADGVLTLKAQADTLSYAKADFNKVSGNIVMQTMLYADEISDGISMSLTAGDDKAFNIITKDKKFNVSGDSIDKEIMAGIWNLLRIEVNTLSHKAIIKLNGKVIGEVAVDGDISYFDGLKIEVPATASPLLLDEIYITKLFEYKDYCPEPVINPSDDYILGINMCSLWREGYHKGWSAISPYEEIIPVIGFYDEGLPEVADWEIKYMAEHGIDYQLLCWYGDGRNGPVKLGRGSSSALHDGYFNAKYSDAVKFAIMWENASNSTSLEAFKKNIVPYWVEYYLTDDRYMTVDNKPIIAIWSVGTMINSMGLDGAREAIEYLRFTCKNLGYDGCIFMPTDGHSTRADQFSVLASIGADATYAYHWNSTGAYWYNQTGRMENYLKYNSDPNTAPEKKITLIPTVSVGFNSIGWHKKRTGLIDSEGWQKVADYAKKTMLPTLKNSSLENMVIISTWNEYGEGTYMMPSEKLGFMYLDNVAKAFTNNPDGENVVPTAAQKARLGYLYPDNLYKLAPLFEADISEYPQTVVHQIKFTEDNLSDFEMYSIIGNKEINENGNLVALSKDNTIIFNKTPLNVNIDNCSYVRITIKGKNDSPADSLSGHFFFATDAYPAIEEASRTSFTYSNGGDLETVYVDMSKNSRWQGNLLTLRVDPIRGGQFEIASIEILENDARLPVKVNGVTLKTYGVPKTENDMLLIPAYPEYGTFTALSAYHNWDKATKTLTVKANGHTVTMTVGSDIAIVDGKQEKLYTTVEMFDNLPLIPYDLLAKYLGFDYSRTDTEINITTPYVK